MSILNSILKVFLGDKSGKDLRKVTPLVDKINDYYISFEKMSNDSLRDKTNSFKKKIFDNTLKTRDNIDELNEKIINESSFIEKEKLFQEVETFELELKNIKRNTLNEILPEAFAVVKETARRFVENTEIEVKATDFDKKISSTKSYVKVESEKATWINSWDAAGKNRFLSETLLALPAKRAPLLPRLRNPPHRSGRDRSVLQTPGPRAGDR